MKNTAPSITLKEIERFAGNKSRLPHSRRELLESEGKKPDEVGNIIEAHRLAIERLRLAKKAGPEALDQYNNQDIEVPIFP